MKTNLSNLPQPAIVLERNSLLLEVARLKGVVEQKDKEVFLFKNEITNITSQLNLVSNVTNNTKSKELSLINEIKQKDNTISTLRSKEQELLNKVSLLEGSNILLLQSIDEFKIDKIELRQDKVRLTEEINILRQFGTNKDIKIEQQSLEIEKLKAVNLELLVNNPILANTVQSIFPNEMGGEESIVLSGDGLQSFSIIEENND
jgi:chromosome segregation ATPase